MEALITIPCSFMHMIQEKSAHYAVMDSICLELVTEPKSVKEGRLLVDSVTFYLARRRLGSILQKRTIARVQSRRSRFETSRRRRSSQIDWLV